MFSLRDLPLNRCIVTTSATVFGELVAVNVTVLQPVAWSRSRRRP